MGPKDHLKLVRNVNTNMLTCLQNKGEIGAKSPTITLGYHSKGQIKNIFIFCSFVSFQRGGVKPHN